MVNVYQLLFFLALGLLAIVIMVFVVAVSLLGRAIKIAIDEQAKADKEHRKFDTEEMENIQGELTRAKKEDRHPDVKKLEKAFNSLKRKQLINNWKQKWINAKPKLLGSLWGALIPGAFFLTSATICIVAIFQGGETPPAYPYMWIAIATMGVGICFVCLSLKMIEVVTRTSEGVAFRREVDVFETSLKKFEEEKKPKLELIFQETGPPFHVKIDSELKIKYAVRLIKGDYAEDGTFAFFAPQGFSFPGQKVIVQSGEHEYVPGYITLVEARTTPLLSGINHTGSILIKVPTEAGEYYIYYSLVCRGFVAQYERFKVIVE